MKRIYTTIYELDSPKATSTPEFQAMRGWYQFAAYVRSRTHTIVPLVDSGLNGSGSCGLRPGTQGHSGP